MEYAYDEDVKRVDRELRILPWGGWEKERNRYKKKVQEEKSTIKILKVEKLKMKNKLIAFMLAAVLGVTGIAATAQAAAAGTEAASAC